MMCSRNAYCAKDDDEGAAVDGIFAPLVCCSNDNIREALRRPVELDVAPPDGMFLVTVPPDARPGQTIRTQAPDGGPLLNVLLPDGAEPFATVAVDVPEVHDKIAVVPARLFSPTAAPMFDAVPHPPREWALPEAVSVNPHLLGVERDAAFVPETPRRPLSPLGPKARAAVDRDRTSSEESEAVAEAKPPPARRKESEAVAAAAAPPARRKTQKPVGDDSEANAKVAALKRSFFRKAGLACALGTVGAAAAAGGLAFVVARGGAVALLSPGVVVLACAACAAGDARRALPELRAAKAATRTPHTIHHDLEQ